MNIYRVGIYEDGKQVDEQIIVSPDTKEEITEFVSKSYANAVIIVGTISTNPLVVVDGIPFSEDTHYYT